MSEDMNDFQVVSLDALQERVMEARDAVRHLFIWDKSGLVPLSFESFGINHEFTVEMVAVAMGVAEFVNGCALVVDQHANWGFRGR